MRIFIYIGLVIGAAGVLYIASPESSSKKGSNSKGEVQKTEKVEPDEISYDAPVWKVVKTEVEYESHVTEEDKLDYQDHFDFMIESAYIQFITDTSYVSNNGIFDIDGTYEFAGDILKTTNDFGFEFEHYIIEHTDKSLVYKSVQEDLTTTLYYKIL